MAREKGRSKNNDSLFLHISIPITIVLQVSRGMKNQVILMVPQYKTNSLTTILKIKQLCIFNAYFPF